MNLPSLTGVILAGGLGRRMGGQDKGLMPLFGKPLYRHVADKIAPQVDNIIINANRNLDIYRQSGYPVISDAIEGFAGPLAGILTGLKTSDTDWVLFVPCDTPFLPDNLAEHLWNNKGNSDVAYARDSAREHPTLSLLNKNLIPRLETYLANGDKKLVLFLQQCKAQPVIFEADSNAFYNLNTPEDRRQIEKEDN